MAYAGEVIYDVVPRTRYIRSYDAVPVVTRTPVYVEEKVYVPRTIIQEECVIKPAYEVIPAVTARRVYSKRYDDIYLL